MQNEVSQHKYNPQVVHNMKNIDRIAEAFSGQLGQELMESSRKRVHWICSSVKGENILDVGCSQGIASIILAREGRYITGIDICRESIDYAKRLRDEEDEITRSFVEFECIDFVSHVKKLDQLYDCIIMGEVLEHLSDPVRFIEYADSALAKNGVVVITVPFGINDYHDHKRTYYVTEIYNTAATFFVVVEVFFWGGWIGLVCTKESISSSPFGESLFTRAEDAFYKIERRLVDRVSALKLELENVDAKYRQVSEQYASLKNAHSVLEKNREGVIVELAGTNKELSETTNRYAQANTDRTELIASLKSANSTYEKDREGFIGELSTAKKENSTAKKELTAIKKELNETTNRHSGERTELMEKLTYSTMELGNTIELLAAADADLQRIHTQVAILQKENSTYQWKLNRIINTLPGKLALRMYRFLRRIKYLTKK